MSARRATTLGARSDAALWLLDVWRQVYWDMVQFFRYRLIVASTLLTSVSMVLAFGWGATAVPAPPGYSGSYFDYVFPGILAVGVMFSCTYTLGYAVIVDFNRRAIEDVVLSPLSYSGFVLARLLGMTLKCALQFGVVLLIAGLGFGAQLGSPLWLALAFVLSCLCFAGLGVVCAVHTNEMSFASVVNLLLIPLTYFSGVFFPTANFGAAHQVLGHAPLALHVALFRRALEGQPMAAELVAGALAYALLAMGVALYEFKRRVLRG
ncbi:ABC transporter permease [Roseateles sp. BYS180W]|uniref:Transport permease protein n=1 Tax=Roseateles rivi TaxID=3299028 RepID=A0ABW7FU19_9BURK